MSCLACKNKASLDRCEKKALSTPNGGSFLYCGTHMKCRKVNQWIVRHPGVLRGIVHIQSRVRGVLARIPIALAGKGVLRRSLCHNDEEIITMDGKMDVHPHDYFSVEEGGKVYWFDQRSMIQWSQKELEIRNPYTRTILAREDTRRLRKLWNFRQKKGLSLYHPGQRTPMTMAERRDNRWLRVAQIVREFGYELHHEHFISLDIPQLAVFINVLTEDTRWMYFENHDPNIHRYHTWLKNTRNAVYTYTSTTLLSSDIACIILTIMYEIRDLEDLVFLLYGAYHRANDIVFTDTL
jgi:hypothetical protein